MPFAEHLCTQQQLTFATLKTPEGIFEFFCRSDTVFIKLFDLHIRNLFFDHFDRFDGPHPFTFEGMVSAIGAGILYRLRVAAVVAFEMSMVAMQCHPHRTIGAEMCFAAAFAIEVFEISPCREKNQPLITRSKILLNLPDHFGCQRSASDKMIMLFCLNIGFCQLDYIILIVGGNTRCRTRQHYFGAQFRPHQHRHISGMIPWPRHRFVAVIMLFIHDDQPYILQGSKKCRSRPCDNTNLTRIDPLKDLPFLLFGQLGMPHGNPITKKNLQPLLHLRRQ